MKHLRNPPTSLTYTHTYNTHITQNEAKEAIEYFFLLINICTQLIQTFFYTASYNTKKDLIASVLIVTVCEEKG